MSSLIRVVANDTLPDVIFQLKNDSNDEPVDVSGSNTTLAFRFRMKGSATTLFEQAMTKVDEGETGYVRLSWPSDGLEDLTPGRYEGQIIITFSSGAQTVLDKQSFRVYEQFAEAS